MRAASNVAFHNHSSVLNFVKATPSPAYLFYCLSEAFMTNEWMRETEFPARVDELPVICEAICDAAKESGMADGSLWKLETAIDEACTNIACYGYKGRSDGVLWIRWKKDNDAFVVEIQDNGTPFDQSKPTYPNLSDDICQRKVGGLGRFIMKKFLDEMHYRREGERNCLTMIKKLDEQPSEPAG